MSERYASLRRKLARRRTIGADRAVGAQRVIWHVGFERNLKRRGPRSFEIPAAEARAEADDAAAVSRVILARLDDIVKLLSAAKE